jgi:ABC-type lipoprotein export system ATPase subunit
MLPVSIRQLRKTFDLGSGAPTQVVINGIDLNIAAGESVTFMGPSGSGKSTLLNLIAGLESATQGQIFIGDKEITRMASHEVESLRLNSIAYVFQFFHLLPTLSAIENCSLIAIEQNRRSIPDILLEAKETLSRLGLENAADKRPAQLSGGMQARVALARALIAQPKIILADEPTGNLDSKSGKAVLDLLFEEQKKRGFTLLLVTHDPDAAQRSDRIVRLQDGMLLK